MHFTFQIHALRRTIALTPVLCLLSSVLWLAACQLATDPAHAAKIDALRSRLPYETQIAPITRSMETVLNPGTEHTVHPLAYNRLQSGMMVVYWPEGRTLPMCHFVNGRIGTDSWSTRGMNQPDDLLYLGTLLTRDNYIGVIW